MKTYREKWEEWQQSVVTTVRRELGALFSGVQHHDFDWESWRSFYDKGYTPHLAVDEAFSRPKTKRSKDLARHR